MLKQWKWVTVIGLLLSMFLVLGACSQETATTEEDGQSNEVETSSSANEKEVDGEPKYGGTFTMHSVTAPDTLDPIKTSGYFVNMHLGLIYNKLLTYETGSDVDFTDYNIIPDLAEDWDVSEDGTVYTFYLRDTNWHDIPPVNGRKVDSEDVIATVEKIMESGHQASLLSMVESIEAQDDKTITFTLEYPFAPFLNFMANHFIWILPKEAINGEVDLDVMGIGTGPFMIEKYETNVQTTFVRNPNFYEEDKPYLDRVIYQYVPDTGTSIAAFRTGKLDITGGLPPENVEEILKSNPDTVVEQELYQSQAQLFMNMEVEPFDDLRVRKAVSLAIDKQGLADRIFGGGEISGPVNPSLTGWALPLEEREAMQPYDPEKAKELLAEAGYPDGFDTTIITTDGYGAQFDRFTQWVAEDLREIGINAKIEMVEVGTYYSERYPNKDYEMGTGIQSYLQEADRWLTEQFHTDGSKNWFGINDPELNKMLEDQRTTLDENERKEKVYNIQRYVLENIVNPIPVVSQYTTSLRKPYIQNWNPHASYGHIHMKDVWLDE